MPTVLSCAQCDVPVCPRCTVWTVVGQKCQTCTGNRRMAGTGSSRWVKPAAVAAVVLAVVALSQFLTSDSVQRGDARLRVAVTVPPVGIGEEAVDGNLAFVVNGFACGMSEIGEADRRRAASGQFCILDLTVRNRGDAPGALAGPAQLLRDADNRTYALDPQATAALATSANRGLIGVQQLNPGIEVQGTLVYDIPEATVPTEAEFHGLAVGLRVGGGRPSARGVRVSLQDPPAL